YRCNDCRAGWSDQVAGDVSRIKRRAFQQLRDCRWRNRIAAMFHIDCAAANMKRRRAEALNTQLLKTDGGANDVDNRVERAHLVKVDMFNWFVVYPGFSFRQPREYFRRAIFNRFRQSGVVNDLENIGKVTMRMF